MIGASARPEVSEAIRLLRVPKNFNADDLRRAKRLLLFESHPDHGGRSVSPSVVSIDVVLASYELLMSVIAVDATNQSKIKLSTTERSEPKYSRDLPSFTINALPVDAYHLLFVAAHELGEVVEEEEPYLLVVRMSHPCECWCEIDVVPDAGASTVSLLATHFGESTAYTVDIMAVRDLWIETINGLQPL